MRIASWRRKLGEAFPVFEGCLQRTGKHVHHARCERCGCNHEVLPAVDENGFMAHCRCEDRGCEPFRLTAEEAAAWLFSPLCLTNLMGHALHLNNSGRLPLRGSDSLDLGDCPVHPGHGRVKLCKDPATALQLSCCDAGETGVGCVLVPQIDATLGNWARATNVALVSLEDCFKIGPNGIVGACNKACMKLRKIRSLDEAVTRLEKPIYDLCKSKKELTQQVAEKTEEVAQMVTDPTGVVAKIAAEFKNETDRNLFYLLICTVEKRGRKRCLSYAEIGDRLGGITKQAVEKRVKVFRRDNPEPWRYVLGIRKPPKERKLSEVGPRERRRLGVDESYGYPD